MKKILIIIALLQMTVAHSQKQANRWYFGTNAGLDFNSGTPTALIDGQVNTAEGVSTMSDSEGNLLFYTDGVTVYNKSHAVMQNGSDLLGSWSSSQCCVAVPKPGSDSLYYIFTVNANENAPDGFRYTEVDMDANGGLGMVTENKNIQLLSQCTEQITATFHKNGTDIWVVVHGIDNNSFYAYLITPAGISTTPVVSNVGAFLTIQNRPGSIKISPDGSKLAIASISANSELFDYNNLTGTISNPIFLSSESLNYSVEFSPSGKVLYISSWTYGFLKQYNLEVEDIAASEVELLPFHPRFRGGGLQRAVDGKIYFSNSGATKLSVINFPDVVGEGCNVEKNSVDLGGREAVWGLPFCIAPTKLEIDSNNTCFGTETEFNYIAGLDYDSVVWDFGDGTTSTSNEPVHTYELPGTYTVKLTVTKPGTVRVAEKVIVIASPQFNMGGPYVACEATDITIATEAINFDPADAIYQWEYNGTVIDVSTNTLQVSAFGTYTVSITVNNCTVTSSVDVTACVEPVIPRGISPNYDGLNDIFDLSEYDVASLSVFNRYGVAVFSVNNYSSQWHGQTDNGQQLPDGTYFYTAQINKVSKSGWVYIIR